MSVKPLLAILGTISLGLGVLGIFLPVLPTTPFLLLAAALYYRSSTRLYDRLMAHKRLGPYIKSFREDKSIPIHAKVCSISLLWTTILISAFLVIDKVWLRVVLLAVATAVTVHILSYKTRRE